MFEPIRGGTRGGQAEFKWSDVSADKDREHYLGHSINAPTGRWQKNKDVHWYNRDLKDGEDEKRAEIRRIKEAEEEAMAQALGFAPTKKTLGASANGDEEQGSPTAGPSGDMSPPEDGVSKDKLERHMRKIEKRAKKAEKKARKEAKRMDRGKDDPGSDYERDNRYRNRRRSRSPRRRDSRERRDQYLSRRSVSPPRVRRRSVSPPSRRDVRGHRDYDIMERERERERDRRRWDANAAQELPQRLR